MFSDKQSKGIKDEMLISVAALNLHYSCLCGPV